MVQSLNTKAMYTFATMVLRRPNLIVPHISVTTISDIDFVSLKKNTDIRAIIFDKDHTITLPYANHIHPHVEYGLRSCIDTFGCENVAILSNSAGTNDDIGYQDAIQIEESLGIPVIRHVTKKPGGIDEVMAHFATNTTRTTTTTTTVTHPTQLCMVGDRLLTDIVFGNIYNMLTIHTAALPYAVHEEPPISYSSSSSSDPPIPHRDNWTAQLLRPLENKILYRSNIFGMKRKLFTSPIPHPAYDNHIHNKQQTFVLSRSRTSQHEKKRPRENDD